MKPSNASYTEAYQQIGKVFYAVAAADTVIEKAEIEKLKAIVKEKWVPLENSVDEFGEDAAFQIEIVFDWLIDNDASELSPNQILEEFKAFKKEHPKLFNKSITDLIISTSQAIAASFENINKAELVILYRVHEALKE